MSDHPLPPSRYRWEQTRSVLRVMFTVLGVAFALWLGYSLRMIALLLVLAVLFAYVVDPAIGIVQRSFSWRGKTRQVPRWLAIFGVYTLLFGTLTTGFYILIPRFGGQLAELSKQIPQYLADIRERTAPFGAAYRARLPESVRVTVDGILSQTTDGIGDRIRGGFIEVMGMFRFFPWLILIPVIAYFLLKDAKTFRSSALHLLPEGRVRWRGRELFEELNQTIALYVRAQLLACLFIGVVCAIAFAILGVPYGLLLGGLAGMLELIPLIGPVTLAVLAGLVAGTHSAPLAFWTLSFLGVLRIVHDYAVYPRLIARGIRLHPLAIIVALLCGAQLAGGVGLFLAIPITAVLSVGYRHLVAQWQKDGLLTHLFGNHEPPPTPTVQPAPAVRADRPLDDLRVLVVDDDEDGRMLLASHLRRFGAEVFDAASVAEALASLQQNRPDILISDIGMQGEDGFDLIRKVRTLGPNAGGLTPAAALTAYATAEDRRRSEQAGFNKHLCKPVDLNELVTTLSSMVLHS